MENINIEKEKTCHEASQINEEKVPQRTLEDINNANEFALKLTFEDGEELNFQSHEEASKWFTEKLIEI